MTNREYLDEKTSKEIGEWLDDTHEDTSPKIEVVGGSWDLTPNFKPSEFVCPCGKCEYSTPEGVMNLDYNLRSILQAGRNKYGLMVITCGARCQEFNDSLPGSIKNSKHIQLKAADFKIPGVTNTEKGRDEVLLFMSKLTGFAYGYHNKGGKVPNMGTAVHVDVV